MKLTPFRRVCALIEAHFPELNTREGWSPREHPRQLLLDTIHLPEKAHWDTLKCRVEGILAGLLGVSVGWNGAEILISVDRR